MVNPAVWLSKSIFLVIKLPGSKWSNDRKEQGVAWGTDQLESRNDPQLPRDGRKADVKIYMYKMNGLTITCLNLAPSSIRARWVQSLISGHRSTVFEFWLLVSVQLYTSYLFFLLLSFLTWKMGIIKYLPHRFVMRTKWVNSAWDKWTSYNYRSECSGPLV